MFTMNERLLEADHAVVLKTISEETKKDKELQLLKKTIHEGPWDKTNTTLQPYIDLQAELYEIDDVILRLDRIIPPSSLREKIIRIAHKQGHLGLSKTKEMIRQKYWWPTMNLQIKNAVKKCFDCQVSTKTSNTEPAQMTPLPARAWETVEIDFCRPFPNGDYPPVVTDQYSRYPEVKFTTTTLFGSTRAKLKKTFSTHVPVKVQTDNGPPFNSHDFTELSKEIGFYHRRITQLHPKAQGQVENFNKLIDKAITIARQNSTNSRGSL